MAIAKKGSFYLVLGVCAGLGLAGGVASADNPSQQRARQAADSMDISDRLQNDNDAVSSNLALHQRPERHDFEVENAGEYLIQVRPPLTSEAGNYRVTAELRTADGRVLERAEGSRASDGATLQQRLEPGRHEVVVTGRAIGPGRDGVDSVIVRVLAADGGTGGLADDNRIARLAPAGGEQEGPVSKVWPPENRPQERRAPAATAEAGTVEPAATSGDEARQPVAVADSERADPARELIQRTVPMRTDGEALRFEVVSPGVVTVESFSTDRSGNYRITGELLDADGNVVASDSGRGFQGDFSISERLEPGIYTVQVSGRVRGNLSTNTYTLRVAQSAP